MTGRWLGNPLVGPLPSVVDRVARLRLHCMSQGCSQEILDAFDSLPQSDKDWLCAEMAKTGLNGQHYESHPSRSPESPAFLLYYGPAWIQRAGSEYPELALRILATVYRLARSVWPHAQDTRALTVTVQCGVLKELEIERVIEIYQKQRFCIHRQSVAEGRLEVCEVDSGPTDGDKSDKEDIPLEASLDPPSHSRLFSRL